MPIAEEMAGPALEMIQEQGQAVTIRRQTSVATGADGGLTPTFTDYAAFAVFETSGRNRSQVDGASRDVVGVRDIACIAAHGLGIEPRAGDLLFRAATATGTPRKVVAVDATQPGTVPVIYRVELER